MTEVCKRETRVHEEINQLLRLNEELRADLYERMKMEDDLRQSEEYHRQLLDCIGAGFILVRERDRTLLDINQHALALCGCGKDEIVGTPLSALISQDEKSGPASQGTLITANGGLPILTTTARMHVSGEPCLAIMFVLSESRKQAETREQSRTMAALGDFAGHVAHDFNNLLTAISGYGQMLELSLKQIDPVLHKQAQEILNAADRAGALTQQLLTFSRRQFRMQRPLDLGNLLGDMHGSVRQILGETIEVRYDLSPDPVIIQGDASQVSQIIMSLASNARDAMPEGGTFTVSTSAVEMDPNEAGEIGIEPGAYVKLSVSDTGCGMPPDVQSRIFQPFFTTKPKGKGVGISLAIAYTFIAVSRGQIRLWSEPEKGTRFDIYWPAK